MSQGAPIAFGMIATPFASDGSLDEAGFRAHLRFVSDAGCGVYLGSGGSGEGHTMSLRELYRLYEIGVEECGGRVPVRANPREPRTAQAMIDVASAAAQAGVEMVQIYQIDAGHGMRPTPAEQEFYYRTILDKIDHPVALSAHAFSGYQPSVEMFARLSADYPQIAAANIIGTPLNYQVALQDALGPKVAIFVGVTQILEGLTLGAGGYMAAEPNIVPYLCRSVVEHFARGEITECAQAIANIMRFSNIVNRWSPASPRWIKMAMNVLGREGGNGVLRPPYLLPPQSELEAMRQALVAFDVEGVEARARAAVAG